jgi:glycosyltransferase involved in cell wall biosynthesis
MVAVDGQARRIVEAAGAGVFVEPEDSKALVKAILDLSSRPEDMRRMGASGRQHILNNFSREEKARDYIDVLEAMPALKQALGMNCNDGQGRRQ